MFSAGNAIHYLWRAACRERQFEVSSYGFSGVTTRAVRNEISPCSLVSVATALGLASLLISFLTPVRKFGTFAAVSVVPTAVVLCTS